MLKFISKDEVEAVISASLDLNTKFSSRDMGIRRSDFRAVADYLRSPEYSDLKRLIKDLSHDARTELIALIWIGRGDADDVDNAIGRARKNSSEGDVDYIVEKAPSLPTYLRKALNGLESRTATRSTSRTSR
jgi:hypothetical protein